MVQVGAGKSGTRFHRAVWGKLLRKPHLPLFLRGSLQSAACIGCLNDLRYSVGSGVSVAHSRTASADVVAPGRGAGLVGQSRTMPSKVAVARSDPSGD